MDASPIEVFIATSGSALAAAIGVLYRNGVEQAKKHNKFIQEQNQKHTELSVEVGHLRGRSEGIRDLSSEVLKTVHKAVVTTNK